MYANILNNIEQRKHATTEHNPLTEKREADTSRLIPNRQEIIEENHMLRRLLTSMSSRFPGNT